MRGLLLFLLLFSFGISKGQERCATNQLNANVQRTEVQSDFEGWLKKRIQEKKAQQAVSPRRATAYQIPVVFHIIHDGSPVGSGSNISDDKILEQLQIINEDFNRTNADASETPAEYQDVAADAEIEFILAKQDPEGLPTSGIVRLQGSKSTYSPSEDALLTSESYWPQNDYLNIYVTDLSQGNLGYAQFPFSNLPGIASELENYKSTDGVVLDYAWTGNNENTGSFDSKGRTATHEIGHYLGLRHIWGDGGCGVDDFCEDTPPASGSSTGCPKNKISCETKDMIQNFMDYTDDVCMNLFTTCQKLRMHTVLEESPRRASLLTSPGLKEPVLTNNDLGIRSAIAPTQSQCTSMVTPGVQVRNYGLNPITAFKVSLFHEGVLLETLTSNVPLTTGETTEINFTPLFLDDQDANELTFVVTQVNGGPDGNDQNNSLTVTIAPFLPKVVPLFEDFEESTNYYKITETGAQSAWMYTTAPDSTPSNQAAVLPFYNQTANFGYQDFLITPTLDFSALTSVQLDFRYAYASRFSENLDGLIVLVSTNCGQDFLLQNMVFERYGKNLRTAGTSDFSFIPDELSDWESVNLNLTKFAGEEQIQIAFAGVNGGGNNIYLDNISVTSANLLAYDIGIKSVENLPVVSCEQSAFPLVEIKNYGYENVRDIEFQVEVNGVTFMEEFHDLFLPSGHSETFMVNTSDFMTDGFNEFIFTISQVNGRQDEQASNDQKIFYGLVNDTEDAIPVQETFENQSWIVVDPTGIPLFEVLRVNGDTVLASMSYGNETVSKSYLISPTLKTGPYNQGAIRFDYSYGQRTGFNDNLKVLLSLNCGKTFEKELLSLNSEQLAVKVSNTEWVPESREDWKTAFIDITEYMNWPELRIALVFSNGNGNRLYLDNINVLTTNDPGLPEFQNQVQLYPNPATTEFNVAFNLPEKQKVNLQVIDISGKVLFDQDFSNIINQTINLKAPSQSGFYILHVTGQEISYTKRLFIRQ